jgi:hypothetical protein
MAHVSFFLIKRANLGKKMFVVVIMSVSETSNDYFWSKQEYVCILIYKYVCPPHPFRPCRHDLYLKCSLLNEISEILEK